MPGLLHAGREMGGTFLRHNDVMQSDVIMLGMSHKNALVLGQSSVVNILPPNQSIPIQCFSCDDITSMWHCVGDITVEGKASSHCPEAVRSLRKQGFPWSPLETGNSYSECIFFAGKVARQIYYFQIMHPHKIMHLYDTFCHALRVSMIKHQDLIWFDWKWYYSLGVCYVHFCEEVYTLSVCGGRKVLYVPPVFHLPSLLICICWDINKRYAMYLSAWNMQFKCPWGSNWQF